MAQSMRPSVFGGTGPLEIVDVEPVFHRHDAFLAGDPVEFHIVLSRNLDELEHRVITNELVTPSNIEVKSDYLRIVDLEHLNFNQIHEFLDDVNARVAQRRQESTGARERARAQAQRIKDGLGLK